MKTNPFHFEGEIGTFPRYTSEQVALWEAMCKNRNYNPTLEHLDIVEMMYDIFTRLDNIESELGL